MTAAVVVSPLLGAAAVKGLCGALVLNGEPCPCACHEFGSVRSARCQHCAGTVGGRGSVAPSVQVGQRLAIAATRTEPGLDSDSPHMDGSWHWSWNKYPDRPGKTGARFDAEASAVLRGGLHLGAVVGSVTATTPALPIVDILSAKNPGHDGPHICLDHGWGEAIALLYVDADGGEHDFSEWLPWLGDDLVGRWAVLIDNPTTTEQRCPACDGKGGTGWVGDIRGGMPWEPCPICWPRGDDGEFAVVHECDFERRGVGHCAPVPLPDDVDLTEGTIVEVDL